MSKRADAEKIILKIFIVTVSAGFAAEMILFFFWLRTPNTQYQRNMNLGHHYLFEMRYDEAVKAFSDAIDISPRTAEGYVGRGDAYAGLNQDDKAQADYIKAVALDPGLNDDIEAKIGGLNIEETPDSTVSVAPAPSPEPTEAAKTFGGVMLLARDATTTVNLDNDQNSDEISYSLIGTQYDSLQEIQITVNGIEYNENADIVATSIVEKAYAADVNIEDGYKNIIITLQSDDGVMYSIVYAYDGDKIFRISTFDGGVGVNSINGDGMISFYSFDRWMTEPDGIIYLKDSRILNDTDVQQGARTAGHLTDENDIETYVEGYTATASGDIPLYSDSTCQQQTGYVSSGETFQIVGYTVNNSEIYWNDYEITTSAGNGWIKSRDIYRKLVGYKGFA